MSDGRLLILDDDPQVGRLIQLIAESAGFEARFLDGIAPFFDAVADWRPTHIAIDLVMPQMDGVQVLVQLAALRCTARIIITSGVGTRVLEAAGRSGNEHGLDMAGVLPKPFSPRLLRDLLRLPSPLHVVADASPAPTQPDERAPTFSPAAGELSAALANGEIIPAFQPQIDCASGDLAGIEALVRWDHPEHGLVLPDRFLPVAERHGLMEELTLCVLQRSMEWFIRHLAQAGDGSAPTLSVNISASALRDASFFERISDYCLGTSVDPTRLIFELTETSAMEDPVASLDILTRMRMKGFQLSIDDFGTGFSSMLQLVRLPFSEIKIDKSFVRTAYCSAESHAVVKSVIELGHSLDLRVVAEGVENAVSLRLLDQLGCDVAQGYFVSRPLSGSQLLEWVSHLRQRSAAMTGTAQSQLL